MDAILRLEGVSKSFGAIKAADDLSLDLQRGEALGILGPNGAGKTTLFNLIGGGIRADAGCVLFEGKDISQLKPHRRCRLGLGRSYQIPLPFAAMTVFENLLVGAVFGAGTSERHSHGACLDLLERTGLIDKANRLAGSLTLLERKRLELARALASQPKLLLLDEIAGGLTEAECLDLIETIRAISAQGISIIWIEHVVHALLSVVTRLAVMNFGRLLAQGAPQVVMADPRVQAVYLGIEEPRA